MNIEGTKHEKAVLVVVAYIIGLTTGLIGFGIGQRYAASDAAVATVAPAAPVPGEVLEGYVPPTEQPPSDAPASDTTTDSTTDEVVVPPGETAFYDEGRLFAVVGDERYVLSLHTDIAPKDNVQGFSTQGIHTNLPAYSASPDGSYVYFCEQQTTDNSCTNFIFDTAAGLIHFVTKDDEHLVTTTEEAKAATWTDGRLMVASVASVGVDTPWKVTVAE